MKRTALILAVGLGAAVLGYWVLVAPAQSESQRRLATEVAKSLGEAGATALLSEKMGWSWDEASRAVSRLNVAKQVGEVGVPLALTLAIAAPGLRVCQSGVDSQACQGFLHWAGDSALRMLGHGHPGSMKHADLLDLALGTCMRLNAMYPTKDEDYGSTTYRARVANKAKAAEELRCPEVLAQVPSVLGRLLGGSSR